MKSWKLAMLGVGRSLRRKHLFGPGVRSSPARTTAPPPAVHKFRREDVYATMNKVSQDVWRAKVSGASAQHMQELFLDGQREYLQRRL